MQLTAKPSISWKTILDTCTGISRGRPGPEWQTAKELREQHGLSEAAMRRRLDILKSKQLVEHKNVLLADENGRYFRAVVYRLVSDHGQRKATSQGRGKTPGSTAKKA